MKYNYCPKCDKAYVKSRLERDRCIYCGSSCETVDVRRNGLYYLGSGVMVAGAGTFLMPRFVETDGGVLHLAIGIALVSAGAVLVLMGNAGMAKAAKELALEESSQ